MPLPTLGQLIHKRSLAFSYIHLSLLLCLLIHTAHAQNEQTLLNVGDEAPPLKVRTWIKGGPVKQFEKGKVYVVEFWATWCQPCLAAMPHLSALARQYKDNVSFIGMDVMEKRTTTIEKVKAVVDRMGQNMDFSIAAEDSNFMITGWLEATGEQHNGIPRTFVVNAAGKLAWIGHPSELENVLPNIVNNTWNLKEALAQRNENRRLKELDKEAISRLQEYQADQFIPGSVEKTDSILLAINEIITKEPKLKYAPGIAYITFSSLLKTDPQKAYIYGKEVLVNSSYEAPAYHIIIRNINWYNDKMHIPAPIYELGAEATQEEINQVVYPELTNFSKLYEKMADMYWRANNKEKAITALQKAIDALKDQHASETTELQNLLQQYNSN